MIHGKHQASKVTFAQALALAIVLAMASGSANASGRRNANLESFASCSGNGMNHLKCNQRKGSVNEACIEAVERCCDGEDASTRQAAQECLRKAAAHEQASPGNFGNFVLGF